MLEGFLILYHPDSDRRLWILTKSADLPLKTEALAGLPVKCRNTAGGDFHPAPRTSFKKILDCRKKQRQKDTQGSREFKAMHCFSVYFHASFIVPQKKSTALIHRNFIFFHQ